MHHSLKLALSAILVLVGACKFGYPDADEDAGFAEPDAMEDPLTPATDAGVPDALVDTQPDASPPGPDAAPPHIMGDLGPGLSTLVGDSVPDMIDGARDVARFDNPVNVTAGPDGTLYVADFHNNAIRQISVAGEVTTLVRQPGFLRPFGMAFTPDGEFFVETDRSTLGDYGGALWKIDLETGEAILELDNSGRARGLASLSDGRLVLVDQLAHQVQLYAPDTQTLTPLAGSPGVPGYNDDVGELARFNRPRDVVVTDNDEIYIADTSNHRIRRLGLDGRVTTVAGNGISASEDGDIHTGSFYLPTALAYDGTDLYVGEFYSAAIRKVSRLTGSVETVAGGTPGFADSVTPLDGSIYACEGIVISGSYLYFTDGNGGTDAGYHRIRRLELLDE